MKKVLLLICCLFLFSFSGNVYANPVPVGFPLNIFSSPYPGVLALLVESIVIGLLVARYKAKFVWFIFLWLPLTCLTFLIFCCYLLGLGALSVYFFSRVLGIGWFSVFCFIVIIGEIGIVVFEARRLMELAKLRFIRNIFQGPLKMKRALLISLAGNIASIVAYPIILSIIPSG